MIGTAQKVGEIENIVDLISPPPPKKKKERKEKKKVFVEIRS